LNPPKNLEKSYKYPLKNQKKKRQGKERRRKEERNTENNPSCEGSRA